VKSDNFVFSYRRFARELTRWFAVAQRDLPWREADNARDGYRVLVSEVMLQQTTVAAVVPFYRRFLERFPDVQTLARADAESEVLPLWAGLGYYSRARNLHAAARIVIEKHNGIFPQNFAAVLALPGVGRYTAGAVCSIAFEQKVPIVDANVARVLSRIFCIEDDIKSSTAQARLWHEATKLVEASALPSQFNPAMMELGALICVPKNPRCEACPVSKFCCAFQNKKQNELPQTTPQKVEKQLHDVCIFIGTASGVLLRQRTAQNTDKTWWRGMWELPRATVATGESTPDATRRLLDEMKIEGKIGRKLKTLRHGVTVHAITLDCFEISTTQAQFEDARLFGWEEIETLAIPSSMRKLLRWLQTHHIRNAQLTLL
jgi:A/G-specific adenine glycosylase